MSDRTTLVDMFAQSGIVFNEKVVGELEAYIDYDIVCFCFDKDGTLQSIEVGSL